MSENKGANKKEKDVKTGRLKGFALFIFALSMVIIGSFALFTDESQNVISGKMGDLGIQTVVEGDVGKQLSVGESSAFTVNTKVNEGADVKIRQRFSVGNIGGYVDSGDIIVEVNGNKIVLDAKGEYVTPISTIKSGASLKTNLVVRVGDMLSGIPETDVGILVITEALQDRNTNEGDFEEVHKVEF